MSAAFEQPGAPMTDWDRVRESFSLDPAVSHLNNGSFGAVPIPVQQAQRRLREQMEANPVAFFARDVIDRVTDTRRELAEFIGADPDGTALMPNATAAAQVVLNSVDLGPGDEILLTDHGYGAVRLAVERLCARSGAVITEVRLPLHAGPPSDSAAASVDDEIVATLTDAVRPGRTRLAIVDHVTSPTAKLLPVARIATAMRELGVPLMVDAAHAPGMLPVDVASIGADFWLGNLHKWAFAPRPTALLSVSPQHRASIRALVVSWQDGLGFPQSLEFSGTLDYTAWLAAPAGIAFLRTLDPDRVRRHNAALAAYGQGVLVTALDIDPDEVPVQPTGGAPVSMRLVPLPRGLADDEVAAVALRNQIAAELGCEVALGAWNGRAYLRLSAQVYNSPDEYDRLGEALPALIARWASTPR